MQWGSRTLTKSAYYFSGGRPRLLLVPNHLRPLSTASTQASESSTTSARAALALGGGGFLGLGGYYVGVRSNSISVDVATATAPGSPSPSPLPPKPAYGTPEDFSRTIEKLRVSFAAEAVTTARDAGTS